MKIMKNLKVLLVAAIFMVSCDSLLDGLEPATSISGEAVLSSEAGIDALRASMYSKMRASMTFTTQYFIGPSAFADETDSRPGASRYDALNNATGTSGTVHLGAWGGSYNVIQDANLLIGAIPDGVLSDAKRDQYRGEALTIRAMVLHNLARTYGYEPGRFDSNPAAGTWNLGAIIRTEPVLDVVDADFKPRSTVTDMYTQIFTDLENARTLLAGFTAADRANIDFANGLTARVHLYAGNWQDASQWAQTTINNSARTLSNTAAGVAGMFFEAGPGAGNHPEAFFKLVVRPDEAIAGSGVNSGPAAYTSDQWMAQIPTQRVIDLYSDDDYRLGWYGDCAETQMNGAPVGTSCFSVNDSGFSIRKWNGSKGNFVDDVPFMRVSEMYLIWAEAAARAANNPAAGAGPLQTLRDARNAGPIPAEALTSLENFITEILNERSREFIVEGHRFWDLKRTGRDVPNAAGDIKFRPDTYRILAPFGAGLLGTNELLVENPGY